VVLVLAAPLEVAFATLVVFWLLVPGTLPVPHAPHLLVADRVVLYAFAFRLIARRGPREPQRAAYRVTPIHGALCVLLVVGFLDGVGVAPSSDSVAQNLHDWVTQIDLLVLFVVTLAVVRTISTRRAMSIIVAVLAVTVAIAFAERFFHHGWSHLFFEGLPAKDQAPGSSVLQTRGGHVRSQVAGQFALEYGWVLAMLVPLAIVAVDRWARLRKWSRTALVLPLLAMVAIVFSASRGAELAAGGAVLFLVFACGSDRRLYVWGAGAVTAGVVFAVLDSSFITSPFSAGTNDPLSLRLDRLPVLFSLVVHRPFTGLGFTGISSVFGGLDDAYALLYATLGVLGVIAWLGLMATAFAHCARTLRAPSGSHERRLGAACLVGIVVVAAACANYDLIFTSQSAWALVILAALGSAAADRVPRPEYTRYRWLARSLLPVGGVGLGAVILALAPVSAAETISVFTVAPWVDATQGPWGGTELVDTLCKSVTDPDVVSSGTSVKCLAESSIFSTDYPGLALVTVRAGTPTEVTEEVKRAFTPIYYHLPMEGGPVGTIQTGKPAWATTAPLSGGAAGLGAMLLLPPRQYRRRRRAPASSAPPKLLGAGTDPDAGPIIDADLVASLAADAGGSPFPETLGAGSDPELTTRR
jgi:hypothetical protein